MKTFYLILFICSNLFSQISTSFTNYDFGDVNVNQNYQVELTFYNQFDFNYEINSFKRFGAAYQVSDTNFTILAGDSFKVTFSLLPKTNILYKDVFVFSGSDSTNGAVINISAAAKYGNFYDAITYNLFDNQLKLALTTYVSGHTSLGYNLARDKMFMEIDNKKVNGQGAAVNTLECVYTGREAVGYTSRQDAQTNYNFNTEHTWPQSAFGSSEPMLSDLYHLFPTDETANNRRANYPFDFVTNNITWEVGGSKLGRNNANQIVFEPRDVHKGDVSRGMLYFLIRYPSNYGNFLNAHQEQVYRNWNELDTVTQIERNRNNAIASLQGKRNPFIDHPEFVNRIFSFYTNQQTPPAPVLDYFPLVLKFDSTAVGDSSEIIINLINGGNTDITFHNFSSNNSVFTVDFTPMDLTTKSFAQVKIKFKPVDIGFVTANLQLNTNVGNRNIPISGIGKGTTGIQNESNFLINEFELLQNYPNPFNPSTEISYQISELSKVSLKVYDILGKEIATLVDDFKEAGKYSVSFSTETFGNASNYGGLTSGIYFYQLTAINGKNNFNEIKKMIYLK